ncbi:MAG: hypothetical protein ACI9J3_001161 [Parvicellaceae bacterium]|jgi:hypothetical protein
MRWIVVALFALCSYQGISQEGEYITLQEIEDMRTRMKNLGYDSVFIENSLSPYLEKASVDLIRTTFIGDYNTKYQQLKISNCSEIESDDFCVKYIIINKHRADVFCKTSNLVFSLRPLDLPLGSEVTIELYHKEGCLPLITNEVDFKRLE